MMPSVPNKGPTCDSIESEEGIASAPCGVFPVESGGPVIGLGFLFIAIAILPMLLGITTVALPLIFLFGGFGLFLIWLGVTK